MSTSAADAAATLRRVVAAAVLSGVGIPPGTLDRPPLEYADWIKRPTSWGGDVELMLLSRHFRTEFDVVDCRTLRIHKFGQGAALRVMA